ncbi:Major intrinsic protein [Macleaya cordata]|uniref:Major intrinsic protein n=1 Tax=Macleaya cordata TaxID=56857 RepID=A0A200QAA0_MACCD|nr:Major intrinsic protein [Macleaya cordata]
MNGKLLISDAQTVETDFLAVVVAHTFAFTVAVYVAPRGGHVNPAVTFAIVIGGHISILTGICYLVAQLLGSTLAYLVLMLVTAGQISH